MLDIEEVEFILEKLDTKEILILENNQNNSINVIDVGMYTIGIEALWRDELVSLYKEKFF